MVDIQAKNAIGAGKSLGAAEPTRLQQALANLSNRRRSLHDVALVLEEKLAPALRRIEADALKEPSNATAPCVDSLMVACVDAESRELRTIEDMLAELIQRLDV